MNLDIPLIVENHLALDALIGLFLEKTRVKVLMKERVHSHSQHLCEKKYQDDMKPF